MPMAQLSTASRTNPRVDEDLDGAHPFSADPFEPDPFEPDPFALDNSRIADYYRETMEDYQVWSRVGYLHAGIWRPWINPFNRNRMLEASNDEIFRTLRLGELGTGLVADLGCGTGAVSSYGLGKFPDLKWMAFSICPEQIAFARSRFARQNIRFEVADFHRLPLEESTVDAVFFVESFCYGTCPERALRETARILKPGGRLVIADGMLRKRRCETPKWALAIADSAARGWALNRFHAAPEIERLATIAGFEIESVREIGWSVLPCLAHAPPLVVWHSLRLLVSGKLKGWRKEHLRACALAVLFGLFRRQFGYQLFSMIKK